ncbi:MAG: sugar transferase [Planctomycetaceae bacterium]|nr:sugar transferase [Planctomycetaceae bacterium]
MFKWLLDIVLSLIALAVLALPMLVIAIIIRTTSPGAAIFRQQRVGLRGKLFTMLKFRTMRSDAEPFGRSPQSAQDPRLTRVGKFLRQTSLDELPQLLNVLAGHMSLVGPRPLYQVQAEKWNARQLRRLDVRPGLTGYAQVYGRGDITHEEKIELDVYYVENGSLGLDLKLIALTLWQVVASRSIVYERPGHGG